MCPGLCCCCCCQENLQLKAHLVWGGGVINNSSAAQWDHKSADGTPEDDRGTAGAPAAGGERGASSEYCTRAEAPRRRSPSSRSLSEARRSRSSSRRIRSKVFSSRASAAVPEKHPEKHRRCQCHTCFQGANRISCCYSGPEGAGKVALVQDAAWIWFFPDSLGKGGGWFCRGRIRRVVVLYLQQHQGDGTQSFKSLFAPRPRGACR